MLYEQKYRTEEYLKSHKMVDRQPRLNSYSTDDFIANINARKTTNKRTKNSPSDRRVQSMSVYKQICTGKSMTKSCASASWIPPYS